MEGDRSSLAALVAEPLWAGLKSETRNGAVVKVAVSPYTGQPIAVGDDPRLETARVVRAWAAMHNARASLSGSAKSATSSSSAPTSTPAGTQRQAKSRHGRER